MAAGEDLTEGRLRGRRFVRRGIVDLRRVCNTREDYRNPIEPGERGGAKIAAALAEACASHGSR